MRNFLIVISIILFSNWAFSQETLPYSEYIDYYRQNVKSTILDKEGVFLKNGKYKFSGSSKDFRFLLSNILKYNLEDFKTSDTFVYEGEIKDSVKVNVWRLILNRENKELDLVYRKEKETGLAGVDFNSKDNNYGLSNKMINLNQYYETGHLGFTDVGGIMLSHYNFRNNDYYITKTENYSDDNNKFITKFNVINKKNNSIIYSESSLHRANLEDKKMRLNEQKAFFQINDSCSLEITTTEKIEKGKKKFNKSIWAYISFQETRKDKLAGDHIIKGKSQYVGVYATEWLRGNKLVSLEFKYDNKENKNDFTDFLRTNYYPFILYNKTPLLN